MGINKKQTDWGINPNLGTKVGYNNSSVTYSSPTTLYSGIVGSTVENKNETDFTKPTKTNTDWGIP